MKIARQRVSATKSGNGLQKTLQTISIWRWLPFILFFYFSVVLVVIREKSPEIRVFPRQPARQRVNHDGDKAAIAGTVKGQEVKNIGSAAKHALTEAVCRVSFIGYLVNLFLSA